jgi:hypothetical protein
MGILEIIAIISCVVTLGGAGRGTFKWFHGIERNTEATDRLTAAFETFAEKTGDALADHEHRLTVLETRADV